MIWILSGVLILCMAGGVVYHKIMLPTPLKTGDGSIKIACVGDSITYSLGVIGNRRRYSYPALLAQRLGTAYTTVNYGLSDRTLLSTADKPYFQESVGKEAWDTDADIVVFMLGSNDCKRKNWNARQFQKEYAAVIRHYQARGKKLLLLIPPKIFYPKATKSGYHNAILRDELIPIVRALREEYNVPCLDLYALTEDHPEWFPDRLHPNKAGNIAMADLIAPEIANL